MIWTAIIFWVLGKLIDWLIAHIQIGFNDADKAFAAKVMNRLHKATALCQTAGIAPCADSEL